MSGQGNWRRSHWKHNEHQQAKFSRDDEDTRSSSSNGLPRKGKQGYPPGLKGKEIGLYFRNLHRKKSNEAKKKLLEVSLDPRREQAIRRCLRDIGYVHEKPIKFPKYIPDDKSNLCVLPYNVPNMGSQKADDINDINIKREIKDEFEDSCAASRSEDHIKKEEKDIKTEENSDEVAKDDVRIKEEVEDVLDISEYGEYEYINEECKNIPHRYVVNPLNPFVKYQHIEESTFKHNFLRSITGSIQDNLERSLEMRSTLIRNARIDQDLKADLLEKEVSNRYYQKMVKFREKLPSFAKQREIIDVVELNQVCLINGETGCGKTTQVAQFILDDYIRNGKGSVCKVICTQPRRISAISVAERVADERAECCGKSVGYQIRLERKLPRKIGSIMFCTTGVLLQYMQSDPALTEVSHLILDEIHERDTICDFVLTILKDVIPKRPDLRVILMSATLDAEQFSRYFNYCPSLHIPGFTYPVTEYYLEDVLQITNVKLNMSDDIKGKNLKYTRFLKHNKLKMRKMEEFRDFIEPYVRHLKSTGKYSDYVLNSLLHPDSEDVNLTVIFALIRHICVSEPEGGILVFLPGWDKISTVNRMLTECGFFTSDRYLIIPLHSLMPTTSQKSIFERPRPGVRKIVLSTNIAETSITIDDIVYVINSGKTKLKNFDVDNNISTLKPEWISLANARQRRGRAGRVQPGICYHTYSRAREQILDNYALPEMLRTRLEEVILQIKILQLGKVGPFLERVLDPPNPKAVDISLKLLQGMNALDEEENLTPLGYHLAKLPMDPQTGKMILMGAIFSCVDPVFSVAASLSFKDAFLVPLGREDEVNRKRDELAGGTKSDHWVIAEAFTRWENAERHDRGYAFCRDYFLSRNTLCLLRDMKRQFAENLYNMNFLKSSNPKFKDSNHNSHNIALVKAIVCAGLYPNVAFIESVKRSPKGIVRMKLKTPEDGRVQIHPRSINERQDRFESPFLIYHLKLKSTAIYLHDTTMIHPLPLLFFGEDIKVLSQDGQDTIAVNNFIKFACKPSTAYLIKELREKLVHLLEYKINHPGVTDWHTKEGTLLRAIIELVTYEDNRIQLAPQDGDDDDFLSD